MKDKNKKELENIVRRDDSGNEIEPPENSVEVSEGKFGYNLVRLLLEKSGLAEQGYKANPIYNSELLREHRKQIINDSIAETLAELEANDVNITEDDRLRVEVMKIEKELIVVSEWMNSQLKHFESKFCTTKAHEAAMNELGKYKKYLENRLVAIQNPAKPDGEGQSTNAIAWALYYYYRHKVEPFPDFLPDYEFRKKKLFEKAHEHGVSQLSFYMTFDAINANTEKRNPLRGGKRSLYLKQVIEMLSDFPKAKEMAEKDLTNNNQ